MSVLEKQIATQTNLFQKEILASIAMNNEANACYNQVFSIEIEGRLNAEALKKALNFAKRKHVALNCVFNAYGPEIFPSDRDDFQLTCHDLTVTSVTNSVELLAEMKCSEAKNEFDLYKGPLIRFTLIKTREYSHCLLISTHHLVCDGWSMKVFLADIESFYKDILRGERTTPTADLCFEPATGSSEEKTKEHLHFWRKRLLNVPSRLELCKKNSKEKLRSFNSKRADLKIGREQSAYCAALSAKLKSSQFEYFVARLGALIKRQFKKEDFVIGICLAGQLFEDRPKTVGHFVRLMPIRFDFPYENFESFLDRTTEEIDQAKMNQSVSFGEILSVVDVERDSARVPLINFIVNYEDARRALFKECGLEATVNSVPRSKEAFEVFLNIAQTDEGHRLECQYNTDLYAESFIKDFLKDFVRELVSAQ